MNNGDSDFTKNEHAWNKEASVLYVDQPAGVGYSYCEEGYDNSKCQFDDHNSA